jgi:hypothetical protein
VGVLSATLFAFATSLSTYATESAGGQTAASSTVVPYITVVDQRTPADLSVAIVEADINAAKIVAQTSAVNGENYILVGEYQACVLSNALDASSSKAGILLKVTKGTSDTHYATSPTGSQTQIALYNSGTTDKVRVMIVVTPSGMTKLATTFGAAGSTSGSYSQYAAVDFAIGGSVASGADAVVYLNDANASSRNTSSVTLQNLALDTYGTTNQFAMNPGLGAASSGAIVETSDEDAASAGLAAAEAKHIDGCTADQDPSTTDTLVADKGLITFKLYANAVDLAGVPAGTYSTSYALSLADIDDISSGVEDTQ